MMLQACQQQAQCARRQRASHWAAVVCWRGQVGDVCGSAQCTPHILGGEILKQQILGNETFGPSHMMEEAFLR
jgi:hypothetical protein